MLKYIVMEMMMKVAESGGVVAFFMAYVFAVTVYIVGGFDEFFAEMKTSFGKVAA